MKLDNPNDNLFCNGESFESTSNFETPSLRVLHCPTMVGGNPQGLANAERSIGLDSIAVTLANNYLKYRADKILFSNNPLLNELKRWWFVVVALKNFDVFHYNFGMSLCPARVFVDCGTYPRWMKRLYNLLYGRWLELRDVGWARRLGKVIAVTYQGDDARQGEYCLRHYPIHFAREVGDNYYSSLSDSIKRSRIDFFDKHADLVYALNPDLLNVLPSRARFMPYAHIDLTEWKSRHESGEPPVVPHVVHAPTNRLVKGSRYIIDAFERLKAEGVEFRYTLLEGMSNADARKVYETADLLVDQLLAGWYGGISVEFMALGKPVICYIREDDLHFIPQEMQDDLPVINATPENIYLVLKEWLTLRRADLKEVGRASRSYVERWHDPLKIAANLKRDYEAVLAKKTTAVARKTS